MSEAAGSVKIILAADASSYSAALELAKKQLNELSGAAGRAGHATVSQMQAASASIRLFEGGMTNNIRAVERFITTIPGVGKALKAIFPVVGGLALAGLFVKLGDEVVKFIQTARQIPLALQNAFEASNLAITTTNDELRKSNDQLANQIALLQGKPANNAAIALDDTRIAADKLAKSLQEDNKQLTELLKANALNPFAALLTGQAPTGASADAVKAWAAELQRRSNNVVIAQHKYGVGSAQDTAAQAALAQSQKDAEAEFGKRLTEAQRQQALYQRYGAGRGFEDQTSDINNLSGYQTQLFGRDDEASLEKTNAQESAKKQKLDDAKKYTEEQKTQQELLVKQWQDGLTAIKSVRDMSAQQEANYWLTLANMAKNGSLSYQKAMQEAQKAMAPIVKNTAEELDKFNAASHDQTQTFTNSSGQEQSGAYDWNERSSLATEPDFEKPIQDRGKALADYFKNLQEGASIQKQNAAAFAEASLQMAVATGQVTKLDAAQVQAQLHTDEYSDTLKGLQDSLANVGNLGLTTDEQKAKTSELNNQIAQLTGSRSIQAMQDAAAIHAATVMGKLSDTVADLANKFTDFGSQLSELTVQTLQNFNSSLSQALMAHAYTGREYRQGIVNSIGGTFRQAGSSGLNMLMQQGEGSLMKLLTGKNPLAKLGTKDNPMYVRSADALSSVPGGGGLLSSLFSGSSSTTGDAADAGGSIFGTLVQGALSGIAGFANGGDTPSNMPFLVGENGPEVMSLPFSTHVTPNNRTTIGHQFSFSMPIDARGSTDPAQIEAACNRAIMAAVPMITLHTKAAFNDDNRRVPPSGRR